MPSFVENSHLVLFSHFLAKEGLFEGVASFGWILGMLYVTQK